MSERVVKSRNAVDIDRLGDAVAAGVQRYRTTAESLSDAVVYKLLGYLILQPGVDWWIASL